MPGLLLDTHILLWWRADPEQLTKSHEQWLADIEARGEPAGISAITLWELAEMVARGRVEIEQPIDLWLQELENHPLISVYPLSARIVAESVRLGDGFHKDPADQIIVATALCHGLRLITADQRILRWGKVLLG
ncbi:MAG: PilT protein domain protein [Bryobacterales bacterium]|nr:PilT protein domain protein [Bryobacterales bacterium]